MLPVASIIYIENVQYCFPRLCEGLQREGRLLRKVVDQNPQGLFQTTYLSYTHMYVHTCMYMCVYTCIYIYRTIRNILNIEAKGGHLHIPFCHFQGSLLFFDLFPTWFCTGIAILKNQLLSLYLLKFQIFNKTLLQLLG